MAHIYHDLVSKIKHFGYSVSAELPCSITKEEASMKVGNATQKWMEGGVEGGMD